MVNFFSDHYGDGINVAATDKALPAGFKADPGLSHGRWRRKIARATVVTLLGVVPDVLRMTSFKSNDRIRTLLLHHGAGGGASTVDIGLYLAGGRHDGAAVDEDLFATDLTTVGATDSVDIWIESANFALLADMGIALWEMVELVTPGTYDEDPGLQYDLAITGEADSVNPITYVIEAEYTAGD